MCSGCKACFNVCPRNALILEDTIGEFNVFKDNGKCINCNLCEKVCPNNNPVQLQAPIFWKQGWAENNIRAKASSGGAASAIIQSFIENGGYVASCLFENGKFSFTVTNDNDTAEKFIGSKYVKSDTGDIFNKIRKLIYSGNKVLFIGLPCQSAGLKNVCGANENLYTIDLICHGTPSPQLLNKFIKEHRISVDDVYDIKFRDSALLDNNPHCIHITPRKVMDPYLLMFLNGVDITDNCYSCKYSTISRASDITLGDAWGQLSDTTKEGVSLVLCQTDKGIEIVNNAGLHLEDVNINKAVGANQQLKHPAKRHPKREKFIKDINNGYSFNKAAMSALPRLIIKNYIKSVLIKMHIMSEGVSDSGYRMTVLFEKPK